MSKERGTFLVTLKDGEQVIFGNNYKPWWQHATEYIYRYHGDRAAICERGWQYKFVADELMTVEYSNQTFYDDGGLKWCQLSEYQSVINDVCREQELAPVDAKAIIFNPSSAAKATLTKKLKEY